MGRWRSGAALAAAMVVAGCGYTPPKNAPLVQGPQTFNELQAGIEGRLNARWPIGSSGAGLDEYLRSQGFKVRRPHARYAEAERQWGGWVLGREARIYWRSDAEGRITERHVVVQSGGLLGGIEDL